MKNTPLVSAATLIGFLCLGHFALAADYWVDMENGDNLNGNGTLEAPWRNITIALNSRMNPNLKAGDVIHVAPGVYDDTPDGYGFFEMFPLDLSVGVSLIGEASDRVIIDAKTSTASVVYASGALGQGIEIASVTVKHTQQTGKGIEVISSATLTVRDCGVTLNNGGIVSKAPALISGCLITNNSVGGSGANGGGVWCSGAATTFANNTISDNRASEFGGGVYCSAAATFTNNRIWSNSAFAGGGGGVYCSASATFTNNTILLNSVSYGGGGGVCCFYAPAMFTNNTISYNSVSFGPGGGVWCSAAPATFTNNRISNNSASSSGGGVCCYAPATFTNNTISNNSVGDYGGGVYCSAATFTNCVLLSNNPSALYLSENSTVLHCTLRGNARGIHVASGVAVANTVISGCAEGAALYADSSGIGDLRIINNCLFNNAGLYQVEGTNPITDLRVMEVLVDGVEGNLVADPLFSDPANGDFHLLAGSPCIGAGVATIEGIEMPTGDMDGNPLPGPHGYDLGAYQSVGEPRPTPTPTNTLVPTNTPTATATPTAIPTPTPQSSGGGCEAPIPWQVFTFDSVEEFQRYPGGFIGARAGNVSKGEIPDGSDGFTDGQGVTISTSPGQLELLLFPMLDIGESVVLMRLSVRSAGAGAAIGLAALDGSMDGSIGTNIPANSGIFQDAYNRMVLLYNPPGTSITPVVQIANLPGRENVLIYLDNLEIFLLPKDGCVPNILLYGE
ncbi:MAG: hypothetical protein ABIH23_30140 [bacterium]